MSEPHDHGHPHGHDHDHPHTEADSGASSVAWEARPAADTATPLVYVDCFSGIAGDMLLGALLDAGLSFDSLQAGLARLAVGGYRLQVTTKQSYGITGTKLDVLVDEAVQPERRLADILALLDGGNLSPWVRATAEAVFRRLAVAEAKIHASPVDAVHFHEVGGVDSIVDIVGCLIGLELLGVREVFASSLPLPGGTVRAQHGLLPAPAPATLEILAGVGAPTRPAPVLGELVTPTGAAILAELATFEQPLMRLRRVGYGYGTKELPWPNAVRVWLGERWSPQPPRISGAASGMQRSTPAAPSVPGAAPIPASGASAPVPTSSGTQTAEAVPPGQSGQASAPDQQAESGYLDLDADEVVVIESNLDDSSPEQLGYAMERLLAAGALDVYFTPIQMKKNRPGTLLAVIARPSQASDLAGIVLRETTTLGVRMSRMTRMVAGRRSETVATPFGPVRVKLKLLGERASAAPEYEDCAALARAHGVPLADVYRAAQLAAEALDQ